jgi:hypothetical protein
MKTSLYFIFSLFLLSQITLAEEESDFFTFNFGQVSIAHAPIPLKIKDFKLLGLSKNKNVKAVFIKDSIQWIRTATNLLVPRALVKIKTKNLEDVHFEYQEETIIPSHAKKIRYTEVFVELFNPSEIKVFDGKNHVETITIRGKKTAKFDSSKLVDYSCHKYNVKVTGLEDEYFSLGCELSKTGKFGNEKPRLKVTWSATNFKLINGQLPPYVSYLSKTRRAKINVIDQKGNKREIEIRANLPKRIKRLKTAIGFGPYMFEAQEAGLDREPKLAPALMFYAKYDFNFKKSLRGFNATVYNESIFNNAGIYLAYEVADALDKKLTVVPLLGAQALTFRYNKNTKYKHSFIYPQGFELVFKNAFDIENYTVVYGMFLSTSSTVTYDNLWLRWGKGYFWEINFIRWGEQGQKASTYGLSVGLPLASFF